MKIRYKIWLIILIVVLFFMIVTEFVTINIFQSHFEYLETKNIIEKVKLFENTLNYEIKKIDSIVGDWAPWDDSYFFIQGEYDDYPNKNLNLETMANLNVDLVMFINLSGQIFYGKAYDFDNWEEVNLSLAQKNIILEKLSLTNNIMDINDSINGILLLPENPIIMATRPITTSTWKEQIAGYLFMGSYLDSDKLNYLSDLTNLSIFLGNFDNQNSNPEDKKAIEFLSEKNDIFIQALNENFIAGYSKIYDITNEPILLIKVIMDRDIYKESVLIFSIFRSTIIFVGLLLGFVLIIFTDKTLLQRLNNLHDQMRDIWEKNDFSARLKIPGKDELNDLSYNINKTLDQLESLNLTLEKKVEERTKEVENLLKQKDDFINQLSHDLKNPITPIINLLPAVINNLNDPETNEILEIINRNAIYIKNLVNDTLKLARLNTLSVKFNIKECDLLKIVDSTIKENSNIINEKSIKIENLIDHNIIIKADELQLREVLNNLLSNAVKYTNYQGVVTFDAKNTDDKKFVIISVKDTGIGLSDEQVTHIFDEFYKADLSRHDFSSTGLGLSICKKIVERHGGKIWAESTGLNMGTTIFFTMPLACQQLILIK